jgi:predicted dehydrogenase
MKKRSTPSVSRRDFNKLSAAAGFAVLTGAARGGSRPNSAALRVGLLGCGGRGGGAAQQIVEGNEDVQLVALADLFQDRIDSTRQRLSRIRDAAVRAKVAIDPELCFTGFDAYKKIAATDIDVLLIATIPYCKPEHFEAAVEHGKHVFTEKPVAVDPAGVKRFIAAAQKHKEMGLSLVAGTQRRHQREYVETMEKIHNGEIGEIVALRAYWCDRLPWVREREAGQTEMEYRHRNWLNYCWLGGDNIVEQHVHNLDVCNWVMNAHPVSVFASGGRTWKPRIEKYGDTWDHFSCDFEYANGVHMTSISRHWDGCERGVFEEAVGTRGRSNCRDLGSRGRDPYVQEHIDLVNSIRGEGPKLHEGVQVAESTMTAVIGRMSAYTGRRVRWDEAMESGMSIVPENLSLDMPDPLRPVPNPVDMERIR